MLKLIVAWIIIMTTVALAQNPSYADEKRAINEVSGELLECSVYFLTTAFCVQGHPDPSVPQLIKDYNAQASKTGTLAITIGRSVGVTDEAVGARSRLMHADMMKKLNNNCTNISVLLEKYSNFCKQLTENADPRLAELLQGKKCTGSYKC